MNLPKNKITALSIMLVCLFACTPEADKHLVYSGYVEGRLLHIAAPQSGWLVKLAVTEGDKVESDQLLFMLDTEQQRLHEQMAATQAAEAQATLRDLQKGARQVELEIIKTQITAQKARVEFARQEKERWMTTAAHDYASKSARDKAIADYDVALAQLKELQLKFKQAQLAARNDQIDAAKSRLQQRQINEQEQQWLTAQRQIKSLSAGHIEQIYYRAGEYLTAGKPVLSILKADERRVRFFVPQAKLSQLQLGQSVTVRVDGEQQAYPAKIDFIAREAEFTPPVIYSKDSREKLVFMVEAKLPAAAQLRIGQPVDVIL